MAKKNEYGVGAAEAGSSLRDFLAARLHVSRRRAKSLLDLRGVWVNDRCVWMAGHVLRRGDRVRVNEGVGASRKSPPDIPARTLVRRGDFLVVDKPAGIVSLGSADGMEAVVRRQLGDDAWRAGHRLDRETSGCLLLVRGEKAHTAAVEAFKARRVAKTYHAVVFGNYFASATTVTLPLDGDRATTRIRCLRHNAAASLLEIKIETGRTHQIRRHLAAVRHPVLGDREHGLKKTPDPRYGSVPRLMLHASSLSLPDPTEPGSLLRAHARLPSDFRRCLAVFALDRPRR